MVQFDNIKTYATDFPKTWSFLGSPEDANAIPEEHKDQIFFLNKEATTFLKNYLGSAKMIKWPAWEPFNERYFKTIQSFEVTENRENEIKKWLYNKPIPFDKFVFADNQIHSGQAVMLTWKMVIKYWEGLFGGDDSIIFDETLNWGLYYWHEDWLFFGMDKIYDKEYEYEKTREYHELKEKFFKKP